MLLSVLTYLISTPTKIPEFGSKVVEFLSTMGEGDING